MKEHEAEDRDLYDILYTAEDESERMLDPGIDLGRADGAELCGDDVAKRSAVDGLSALRVGHWSEAELHFSQVLAHCQLRAQESSP